VKYEFAKKKLRKKHTEIDEGGGNSGESPIAEAMSGGERLRVIRAITDNFRDRAVSAARCLLPETELTRVVSECPVHGFQHLAAAINNSSKQSVESRRFTNWIYCYWWVISTDHRCKICFLRVFFYFFLATFRETFSTYPFCLTHVDLQDSRLLCIGLQLQAQKLFMITVKFRWVLRARVILNLGLGIKHGVERSWH